MTLTDIEWLRFVTFAFVAAGIWSAVTLAALLGNGMTIVESTVGAVGLTGGLGVTLHLTIRKLLHRPLTADEPDTDENPAEETL